MQEAEAEPALLLALVAVMAIPEVPPHKGQQSVPGDLLAASATNLLGATPALTAVMAAMVTEGLEEPEVKLLTAAAGMDQLVLMVG